MGLFEHFPYSNFHELNDDWIIQILKELYTNYPPELITQIEENISTMLTQLNGIDYRIIKDLTKLGTTSPDSLYNIWIRCNPNDIVVIPAASLTNPPEASGIAIIIRAAGVNGGGAIFLGDHVYTSTFTNNTPGSWIALIKNTDIIPVNKGGTGATNAADARHNLGIDFSGEVLSVCGVGADTGGNVQLNASDVGAMAPDGIMYFQSQTVNAATNAEIMRINNSAISTDTVVLECVFTPLENIQSDITWTSYNGYIVFVGTCTAVATANVVLGRRGN